MTRTSETSSGGSGAAPRLSGRVGLLASHSRPEYNEAERSLAGVRDEQTRGPAARCVRTRDRKSVDMRPKLHPLIEETLVATVAMTGLGVVVAGLYWLIMGLSPWPFLVLGEIAGFGFGIVLLALTAPRRRS